MKAKWALCKWDKDGEALQNEYSPEFDDGCEIENRIICASAVAFMRSFARETGGHVDPILIIQNRKGDWGVEPIKSGRIRSLVEAALVAR